MNKRGMILVIVFLFSLSFVYAEVDSYSVTNSCSNNNILFKVSGISNAHAALWNDGIYDYSVCYTPSVSRDLSSSHICTGSNKVLKLSGITDAHAQGVSASGPYSTDVCYDGLNCISTTANCPSNSQCVVKLSN